jgi:hypothetical protein
VVVAAEAEAAFCWAMALSRPWRDEDSSRAQHSLFLASEIYSQIVAYRFQLQEKLTVPSSASSFTSRVERFAARDGGMMVAD